jgi:halimadienyl-diphosphate synthase
MEELHALLKKIGPGKMSSTAYDTAWVARLNKIDPQLSNRALEWINVNQSPDGSWGTKDVLYYHDRVICTLAAMIALMHRGRRAHDKLQIENGLNALERITSGATQGLASDPNGATIGFEMIAPTLVAEAEKLGIIKQQGDRILGRLSKLRAMKMEKLAGRKINYMFTPAFSSEMAGMDGQAILDIDNLQEENGSVANSPSATAYFAAYLKPGEDKAMAYLHKWMDADGGLPNASPFDVFEPAWTLWNLKLIPDLDAETIKLCQTHLDGLQNQWDPKAGIAHTSKYAPKDGDDSALTFETLSLFGRTVDIQGVLGYEEDEYFRCFALEANPSISANIHVLGALREGGFEQNHPSVQKVLKFLKANRNQNHSWFDKWHASPFYATSHAIILGHGYDKEMCESAVAWITKSQNSSGSWGFYKPTAEETAYSIQALCIWKRAGYKVEEGVIELGLNWLLEHTQPPYTPLWIGKALYCPELVVQASILSAIQLARKTI